MVALLPPRPRLPQSARSGPGGDDAIFFVLRTGSQWGTLSGTKICLKSSAHRRYTERVEAGVFHEFWRQGRMAYDARAVKF